MIAAVRLPSHTVEISGAIASVATEAPARVPLSPSSATINRIRRRFSRSASSRPVTRNG